MRLLLAAALLLCLPARAGELSNIGNLVQGEFRHVSEDLGAIAAYKGVTPATPLGIVGFDIGAVASFTEIQAGEAFRAAGADVRSNIPVVKLQAYKGLVAGLDVGAFVGLVPTLSGEIFGADLRYAFIDDSISTPALAARVSATTTHGFGGVDVSTAALDVLLSKRLTAFTPYIGAGYVRVASDPNVGSLREEKFNKGRVFAGLNANLAVVNFAFEIEKMGEDASFSAKLGWRF